MLPTCFDYRRQGVLYLPADMPDPRDGAFLPAVIDRIDALVRAAGGRSLCLFTSIRNMEAAYEALTDRLPFPCLLQGQAPKNKLLERKRAEPETVLFATASFWEGVDIAGDALRCVVIDKLPFASPSEPIVAARLEQIERDGGAPFPTYQLPAAIIMLKQGLGRLIRTIDDRGVLALLDSRVHTKNYGRRILGSLPPFSLTTSRESVMEALRRLAAGEAAWATED
jgi:ATP-dependent DNA helicase DinG